MTEGPRHIGEDLGGLLATMAEARESLSFAPPAESDDAERARYLAERKRDLMTNGIPAGAAAVIAASNLAPCTAITKAREWFRNPARKQVLVLAGPKDACKTTAASCAVDVWPWRGLEQLPRLVAWENVLGPWYHRPSDSSPHDEVTRLRRRDLLTAALLVLDDVGQEASELAPRFGEALDLLLKTRCDAGLYTIITTNYECLVDTRRGKDLISGLVTRYDHRGPRIGERLTEFATWARCEVEGFRSAERREAVLRRRAAQEGTRA
jgi:hypothetical protein